MPSKANRQALRVALIYVIVAVGWILFTDELLQRLVTDPGLRVEISMIKGCAFVLLTGGLLYLVVRGLLRSWEREAGQRDQAETARLQAGKQAEDEIKTILATTMEGFYMVDTEGRFLDVNDAYCRMIGYGREELLRMAIKDIEAMDTAEAIKKRIQQIQETGQARFVTKHKHKDGGIIVIEASCSFLPGDKSRLFVFMRDITARQQVMDKLEETTAQLIEAQQVAGLGSYVFDLTSGRWTGSEILSGIFGIDYPGEEREAAYWLELVHPEDRGEMQHYLSEAVLKERKPFDRIYRIVRMNDRAVRWVHGLGKLVLDEQGQVVRMIGVIQDITGRIQAEEQMNLQFSALSAAANAIIITDRSGKIEWVNPAFSKLSGYSAEEAIGNHPRMLKSGRHSPGFYASLWATILDGNVWQGEIINRRKDGRLYTEDATITPVQGADGQITHFVAIKQDVTEQRQFEKRIQQAQKMEAIGTLAGGIAHDFNNILAAMYGYAYLLQQETGDNPAAQDSIGEILKATSRAKDLVRQILTFSRQCEQKSQVIQLDTVVKEAVKFLRASLPAQIKIEMNLAAGVPAVLADSTQIYQVAINLATNALHAMEGRAGQLTVSLEPFLPDPEFIRLHAGFPPAPGVRLTVADTGHGMDAQTLERIFEPFFTTKPIGKGTGLGLAVVHGIVESHHGVIAVESEVGRGTTFRLYFPGQADQAQPAIIEAGQPPRGSGEKILLLDDEPALTGALQRLLARLGYRVTTSNSAREVIRWFQNDPAQFDLVITDLTMPEMNGLEVARQLHARRPGLPVILASGFSVDMDQETLLAARVVELLEKPISGARLAEAVRRALDQAGA